VAIECELKDHGALGVETWIYRKMHERDFTYSRCWSSRALALTDAEAWKAEYRQRTDGWRFWTR